MSPFRRLSFVFIAFILTWKVLGLVPFSSSSPSRDEGPVQLDRSSRTDTVRAGQVFVTNLPDSLGGRSVDRYRGMALPAKSWLLQRSFFWQTANDDIGKHDLWFRAFLSSDSVDSLVVHVVVEE